MLEPYVTGDGWLRVPLGDPGHATVEIEAHGTDGWQPAYLDYDDAGNRVAQIRWDGPVPETVNLRVDGEITGWYAR